MARASRPLAAFVLGVLLGAAAPADSPVNVPEPAGLYEGAQHGYTPPTLAGATVLDLAAFDRLVAESKPILIDVGLADHKPANLPPTAIWRPTHRSIPGAVWLPNAGAAPLPAAHEDAFLKRVEALTGGDKAKPIVTFCHPECWGSWNAGKRLVAAGYSHVHWFPLGVEGWQDQHENVAIRPDAQWSALPQPSASQ